MNISFKDKDPKAIIKKIEDSMKGRQLADLVKFEVTGSQFRIIISKFGQSFIDFDILPSAEGTQFKLKAEKVALTHRAFKNEVTEKIKQVVEKAGGKVIA